MRAIHRLSALLILLGLCGAASLAVAAPPASKKPAAKPVVAVPRDVKAPPADAETTASGLATKVLSPGQGTVRPTLADSVKIHYSGWTTDGKMFDSSVARGKPLTFRVDGVIPGFSEGLQLMVEGEKRRMWIPARLAYEGQPGKPQGMLVFDVELLQIVKS
jgi:peptidylprolyl isomerase